MEYVWSLNRAARGYQCDFSVTDTQWPSSNEMLEHAVAIHNLRPDNGMGVLIPTRPKNEIIDYHYDDRYVVGWAGIPPSRAEDIIHRGLMPSWGTGHEEDTIQQLFGRRPMPYINVSHETYNARTDEHIGRNCAACHPVELWKDGTMHGEIICADGTRPLLAMAKLMCLEDKRIFSRRDGNYVQDSYLWFPGKTAKSHVVVIGIMLYAVKTAYPGQEDRVPDFNTRRGKMKRLDKIMGHKLFKCPWEVCTHPYDPDHRSYGQYKYDPERNPAAKAMMEEYPFRRVDPDGELGIGRNNYFRYQKRRDMAFQHTISTKLTPTLKIDISKIHAPPKRQTAQPKETRMYHADENEIIKEYKRGDIDKRTATNRLLRYCDQNWLEEPAELSEDYTYESYTSTDEEAKHQRPEAKARKTSGDDSSTSLPRKRSLTKGTSRTDRMPDRIGVT